MHKTMCTKLFSEIRELIESKQNQSKFKILARISSRSNKKKKQNKTLIKIINQIQIRVGLLGDQKSSNTAIPNHDCRCAPTL